MAAPLSVTYTPDERLDTVARVCDYIEDGEMTETACDKAGIASATLRRWVKQDATLQAMYARARSVAADALAEQGVAIALAATPETAQAARVKYDALRWLAGKRRPKDYGDRVEHEVSGTVGVLHLDALRRVDATARKLNAGNDVAEAVVESVTPITALPADTSRDDAEGPPSP